MKCKKHPQYKGVYQPRIDCDECWKVHNERKLNNTTDVKIRNYDDGYDTYGGGPAPLD